VFQLDQSHVLDTTASTRCTILWSVPISRPHLKADVSAPIHLPFVPFVASNMVRSCRSGKWRRGHAAPFAAEPPPRPNAPPGILVPEDHLLADPPPPSFPPACSAEQRASALALFEETDEEIILASGVAPRTDDDMDERLHGGTRPSGDANANAAPPPVLKEAAGQVGGAASVRNDDPRRPCLFWEAAAVPNWAAVPKADDVDGLVRSASDGYVVLEAAIPLSSVVPLLAMTRRQKNLKMRLLFNGYPLDRCDSHPGGRGMEDARLMFVYKPPRLPMT